MGTYLEDYLESVNELPMYLRGNCAVMTEMDKAVHDVSDRVVSTLNERDRVSGAAAAALDAELKECDDVLMELASEKVAIATQTYDLVDFHVRRLDQDLRRFQSEMKALGIDDEVSTARLNMPTRDAVTDIAAATGPSTVHPDDVPVDPSEPVYCLCQQVAFGEMIACDSSACRVEWFHYPCVGLTPSNRPKNKWYCPECSVLRRRGLLVDEDAA